MFRLASLATLALLGTIAWACSGAPEAVQESPVTNPGRTESPTLPTASDDAAPPPAESKDGGAGDADPKNGEAGAPPKTDGGKPAPPSCPGRLESEPNDSPTGEYDELGAITCASIAPTDIDHFYIAGNGDPIRYTFEAEKGAKLEVWTVLGPVETVPKTTQHTGTITTSRKIFFRVSEGTTQQTYRITITRL